MMSKEKELFLREEDVEQEGEVFVHAEEAADVQVLFEALSDLASQPHLLAPPTGEARRTKTVKEGGLNGLSCHGFPIQTLNVSWRQRVNLAISPEFLFQGVCSVSLVGEGSILLPCRNIL